MEPGQEVGDPAQVTEQTVNPSSIAYTVEIHLMDEGYGNQDVQVAQQLTVEGDGGLQEQPTGVVITDSGEGMSEQHQVMTTEQIDPNMITFSESDPPTNLHHLTVSSDMMTYLPESSIPQSEGAGSKSHHQIIMTQHQTSEGITEVKLVDSIPAESGRDVPMLLVQPQAEDPKPEETAADSQQGGETMKEMETQIASAVEALEALTGLATTFNAWAQHNPQVLEEPPGPPVTDKPHKSEKRKSGKHKSKKHKSGKHKKKDKKEKYSIDTDVDSSCAVDDMWKCKTCGRVFPTKLKLKNHMISHSDKRPYTCNVCGSAFKRARYLQIHKKSHFSETQFACEFCNKAYFEKKRLRSHMKCHINPLNCEICGKSYGDKRGLEIHYRSHTQEKPYVCRLCGRGFTSKAGVNKHERSHSGLKPYVCKTCGRAYTQPTNLSDHERTHINERTFACLTCRKVFLARSSLRRHRIKNHPGEDPNVGKLTPLYQRQRFIKSLRVISDTDEKWHYKYTCAVCDKKFKKEKYLKKHSKIHTAGTKACSFCSKSFRDKRDLQNHERRHTGEKPYKCSSCGKAFVSSSAMLRHEKCHLGLRPYVCSTCGKGFTRTTGLRDHELIHKGKNKRFSCTDCDKIFASRSALRSHARLKHQLAETVDVPMATVEVPVETEEGEAVSYIKLMFTEA